MNAKQKKFPLPPIIQKRKSNAGRKPKGETAGVPHIVRDALEPKLPVYITVRLKRGLPGLRSKRAGTVLEGAFAAGSEKDGFRVVGYAAEDDLMHLVVETEDRTALSRGMQGLLIRIAKALNRLWGRRGTVFADRYRDRILKTQREVRDVLEYVRRMQ